MADTLLAALCSICHIAQPQYRCPRCSVRTCSLACVRRHKAWSQCSGERDATAYVPRSRLRTAAGVDHDYNFLHGIELAAERAERVLVGERGVVQADELRPVTAQEVRWRTGRDGRRKRVLVTRVVREGKGRVVERHLAGGLARQNIEMVCAPLGMARQRENHTTLNRRTGRINWQVEWLTWGVGMGKGEGEGDGEGEGEGEGTTTANTMTNNTANTMTNNTANTTTTATTRVLSKVMDDVPLCRAHHGMLEEQARPAGRVAKRIVRPVAQSAGEATWQSSPEALQDPGSGMWVVVGSGAASVDVWPAEKEREEREAFEYFLLGRRTKAGTEQAGAVVTRVGAGESLREVLANTRVLEFPTIYVLRSGSALPAGFVLGPKDFVPVKAGQGQGQGQGQGHSRGQGVKREGGPSLASMNGGRPVKRMRGGLQQDGDQDGPDGRGGGEGQVEGGIGDEGDVGDVGDEGEGGDVIAEQELMGDEDGVGDDDDDDDDDEGDTTSSSGSDSEEGEL